MKASQRKGVATHPDPELCVASRKGYSEPLYNQAAARISRTSSSGKSLEKFGRKNRIEVTATGQAHSSRRCDPHLARFKGASMRRYPMIVRAIAVAAVVLARAPICRAQGQPAPDDSGTSTDLFIMLGPDVDRPGLAAKANYNVGIGHTFGFLQRDLIGDEVTVAYTYEN